MGEIAPRLGICWGMEALTSRQVGMAVRRPDWGKKVGNPHSIPAVQKKVTFPNLVFLPQWLQAVRGQQVPCEGTGAVLSAMSRC